MKKLLALILALIMSLSLVACGGGGDDAESSADGEGEGSYEINYFKEIYTLNPTHVRSHFCIISCEDRNKKELLHFFCRQNLFYIVKNGGLYYICVAKDGFE